MENRILFALFIILQLFIATNAAKCGAMRLKLSKQQCSPKIGHEDKVQPCINLCTKKLVPVKQCSKQPHCCIHNCACVMKGAGTFNLPKQFWPAKPNEFKLMEGCSPTATDCDNGDQKIKDEKKISNSPKQVKTQIKGSPATKRTPKHRVPKKPVPTASKSSRPTRPGKNVKPQRKLGKTFVRATSKKPQPRPSKRSNPSTTTTKKPCKEPSPFMNLFTSRFSSFLSGMGFVVSNNNNPC